MKELKNYENFKKIKKIKKGNMFALLIFWKVFGQICFECSLKFIFKFISKIIFSKLFSNFLIKNVSCTYFWPLILSANSFSNNLFSPEQFLWTYFSQKILYDFLVDACFPNFCSNIFPQIWVCEPFCKHENKSLYQQHHCIRTGQSVIT